MVHIKDGEQEQMVIKALRTWRLFSPFSEAELKELLPLLEPAYKVVSEGEAVISVGDRGDRLYLVTDGRFEERREHGEEGVHEIGLYKPGGFFGLYDIDTAKVSPVKVAAIEKGELLSVRMDKALDDPRFNLRLYKALFHETLDLSVRQAYKIDVLYSKKVRDKLLIYFQTMRDKHGSDVFTIRMTQGELAEYLGVYRTNLSGELKRMCQEGVLRITDDRTYEVLSWDAWTKKDKKNA